MVGLRGANGVVQGQGRVAIHHRALRGDPELRQHLLGDVDPALGRVPDLVDIDQLADDRLILGGDHREVGGAGVGELARRGEQLAPAGDLVEEDQDPLDALPPDLRVWIAEGGRLRSGDHLGGVLAGGADVGERRLALFGSDTRLLADPLLAFGGLVHLVRARLGLVGHVGAPTSALSGFFTSASSPAMIACRAPGTPYS